MQGGFRHLLDGTSLPFLLPIGPAPRRVVGRGDRRRARGGDRPRGSANGCGRRSTSSTGRRSRTASSPLARIADRDRRRRPRPVAARRSCSSPATCTSPTSPRSSAPDGGRIVQAVCSPVRNPLPSLMRWFSVVMSYGLARPVGRRGRTLGEGSRPAVRVDDDQGPLVRQQPLSAAGPTRWPRADMAQGRRPRAATNGIRATRRCRGWSWAPEPRRTERRPTPRARRPPSRRAARP